MGTTGQLTTGPHSPTSCGPRTAGAAARAARLETARVWASSACSCVGVSVTASSAAWPAAVFTPSCAPAPGATSAITAANATSVTPNRYAKACLPFRRIVRRVGRWTGRNHWPKVENQLDVEADGQNVAVVHLVRLALEPLQTAPGRLRVAAALDQVVPAHHLAADEAARDVGMDRARGLQRRLAAAQRPASRLLLARGEERDQPERLEQTVHDLVQRRRPLAERGRLLLGQVGQLRLELQVDALGPVHDRHDRLRRQRLELG